MQDDAGVKLVEILHELDLTEEMVRDHVIRPDHIKAAALRIELHDVGDGDHDPGSSPPSSGLFYRLNVQNLSIEATRYRAESSRRHDRRQCRWPASRHTQSLGRRT